MMSNLTLDTVPLVWIIFLSLMDQFKQIQDKDNSTRKNLLEQLDVSELLTRGSVFQEIEYLSFDESNLPFLFIDFEIQSTMESAVCLVIKGFRHVDWEL
jgi:hypothetical protein